MVVAGAGAGASTVRARKKPGSSAGAAPGTLAKGETSRGVGADCGRRRRRWSAPGEGRERQAHSQVVGERHVLALPGGGEGAAGGERAPAPALAARVDAGEREGRAHVDRHGQRAHRPSPCPRSQVTAADRSSVRSCSRSTSPETVSEIEIRSGATPLATRSASANAPTVELLAPNGGEVLDQATVEVSWSASDVDGDPLLYVVQFSADGGSTWTTLESGWPSTSVEIDRSALAGTTDGRFRVQASDSLLTATDDSDGAFSVADNAPDIAILQPRNGELFDGQALVLEAMTVDPEDGALAGAALTWTSGLDGAPGTGSPLTLPVDSLTEGLHVLTLTAQDSAANVVQTFGPVPRRSAGAGVRGRLRERRHHALELSRARIGSRRVTPRRSVAMPGWHFAGTSPAALPRHLPGSTFPADERCTVQDPRPERENGAGGDIERQSSGRILRRIDPDLVQRVAHLFDRTGR